MDNREVENAQYISEDDDSEVICLEEIEEEVERILRAQEQKQAEHHGSNQNNEQAQGTSGPQTKSLLHFTAEKSGMNQSNLILSQGKINRTIQSAMAGSAYMKKIDEKKSEKNKIIQQYKDQLNNILTKSTEDFLKQKRLQFDKLIEEIENERDFSRFWMHIDLDMFYVAVEIRDNPILKDQPVAVGTSIISTSNYIARQYGVRSAMPTFVAK